MFVKQTSIFSILVNCQAFWKRTVSFFSLYFFVLFFFQSYCFKDVGHLRVIKVGMFSALWPLPSNIQQKISFFNIFSSLEGPPDTSF
jgi:hypothetical protein